MKHKVRYTDEPMGDLVVIPDFLPPPDQLIFKVDAVKVTLSLSGRSVYFFKTEAERLGVPYQRMIRRLVDAYVDAYVQSGKWKAPPEKKEVSPRSEQSRKRYRKR